MQASAAGKRQVSGSHDRAACGAHSRASSYCELGLSVSTEACVIISAAWSRKLLGSMFTQAAHT